MDWITGLREQVPGMRPQARQQETRRPWCQVRNATAPDVAEVLIYDEISDWWGVCAEDVVTELRSITAPNILVRVNSPGGSVFEGLAIANALRAHPATVTVQVDGLAASIASVIALAGDRLVMAPNSMLMIHEASGGCLGNAADMQQMAGLLDKISDNIAGAYAAKAGGDAADWRALMLAETWYNAAEAVEAGLADEMSPARAAAEDDDDPEMRNSWDLSVFRYAGRQAAPAPATAAARVQRPASAVRNVLRQFDEGDRVRIVGTPHEPGHNEGTVAVVNGNAYGIVFDTPDDDTEPGEPYLWYVDNELQFVAEGSDGGGYGSGEDGDEPLPGVSHPGGVPQAAAEQAVTDPSTHPADTPPTAVDNPSPQPVAEAPTSVDTPSPADTTPAADAADPQWAALAARLTSSTPSADDEFARLKEAML